MAGALASVTDRFAVSQAKNWRRQRQHAPHHLARDGQRLTRSGKNSHIGVGVEERVDKISTRSNHVFAVVEDDQARGVAEHHRNLVDGRRCGSSRPPVAASTVAAMANASCTGASSAHHTPPG